MSIEQPEKEPVPLITHAVQPDQSPAKLWVKKPGGAIRRNDKTVVSPSVPPP